MAPPEVPTNQTVVELPEMSAATTRSVRQIVRSRSIGCWMGSLIGAGWMAYGLSFLPNSVRVPLGLIGLVIVLFLLRWSRQLLASSRNLPEASSAQRAVSRGAWKWFWVNLVAEIVLLNVAVNLLAAPALRIYWIPAISLVVGLHFLPMARFFSVPSYWVCGGAMVMVAALTMLGVRSALVAAPFVLVAVEAIVNAFILWATAAWGLQTTSISVQASTLKRITAEREG